MLSEEEVAPSFVRQNHLLKFERKVESMKHSAEKLDNQTMKFTHPAVALPLFYPWICLYHTFAVRNLILRCLTGSHMTILSKSNYCVRLNVNLNIADSISFYFNFGKGRYFVLKVKQYIFDKARFF